MPWIFGYGSLMWDPFFPFLRREHAVLPGYHRAFVMAFARVWGEPKAPCVVLGLEPGGRCEGVAYEVETGEVGNIEKQLRAFEGEAFEVTRTSVFIEDQEVEAMVALIRSSHQDYLGRVPEPTRVAMVVQAAGPEGSCLEYVQETAKSLERFGIEDRGVLQFLAEVEGARDPGR